MRGLTFSLLLIVLTATPVIAQTFVEYRLDTDEFNQAATLSRAFFDGTATIPGTRTPQGRLIDPSSGNDVRGMFVDTDCRGMIVAINGDLYRGEFDTIRNGPFEFVANLSSAIPGFKNITWDVVAGNLYAIGDNPNGSGAALWQADFDGTRVGSSSVIAVISTTATPEAYGGLSYTTATGSLYLRAPLPSPASGERLLVYPFDGTTLGSPTDLGQTSSQPAVLGRGLSFAKNGGPFACNDPAGADSDSDVIHDVEDNCSEVANGPNDITFEEGPLGFPNQTDTDLDGFGDLCDADFDQDGVVTGADFGTLINCFQIGSLPTTLGPAADPTCEESDMDDDGLVAMSDFNRLVAQFNQVPGPSGLACADPTGATAPCFEPHGFGDTDEDGRFNLDDTCVLTPNNPSVDTDSDLIGNRCDSDYDQNGTVDFDDFAETFLACFGTTLPTTSGPPEDPTCEESDHNLDGAVGLPDFVVFLAQFRTRVPGPTGIFCSNPFITPPSSLCVPL